MEEPRGRKRFDREFKGSAFRKRAVHAAKESNLFFSPFGIAITRERKARWLLSPVFIQNCICYNAMRWNPPIKPWPFDPSIGERGDPNAFRG